MLIKVQFDSGLCTARWPIKERHEATKVRASRTIHTKLGIREYYNKQVPREIQYKIGGAKCKLEDNTWTLNGEKEINTRNRQGKIIWTVGMVVGIQ